MAESEQGLSEQEGKKVPKRQADAARRLAARRAAKAAAKASKRGADTIPDRVEEKVESAASWYEQHARTLWIAIVVGVAIGFGAVLISEQAGQAGREGARALAEGVTTSISPIVAEDAEKPEGVDETYVSATARAETAMDRYRAMLARHGNEPAAPWAQLGEATALYTLGKHGEAEQAYDKALQSGAKGGYLRARALEGAGFALEAQDKHTDAQKRFEELAELDDGAFAPLGKYHAARMLVAQKQPDKAVDLLDELVKAERERAAADGNRFESVLGDAETLLGELGVATGRETAASKAPGVAAPNVMPGGGGGGGGLSQEIVDALRKQLEQKGEGEGEEGKGLTKEIVDALQQNVNDGESGNTMQLPAGAAPTPAPAPAKRKPVEPPAPAKPVEPPPPAKPVEAPTAPAPAPAAPPAEGAAP